MECDKVLGIFDSLITPISTYACAFWLPYIISKAGFLSSEKLMESWGNLKAETLNQRCCRMFLSVHSKASRLAVLGELGRYPLFINALSQCLNYKLSLLKRRTQTNLIGNVLTEMENMVENGQDCWLTRISQIEKLLKTPKNMQFSKLSGKKILSLLKSKFDGFWLNKINEFKASDADNLDHNKLRVYRQFKASFTAEPYINLVRNRNQRSSLTRIRISAHNLATELLRRTRPVTPLCRRQTKPSDPEAATSQGAENSNLSGKTFVDSEQHFMLHCDVFKNTRSCLFEKLSAIMPGFKQLSDQNKLSTLMCPTTPRVAKLVNRFIKFMFQKRESISSGVTNDDL